MQVYILAGVLDLVAHVPEENVVQLPHQDAVPGTVASVLTRCTDTHKEQVKNYLQS